MWLSRINSPPLNCGHNIYTCNSFTCKFYAGCRFWAFKVWHSAFCFPNFFFSQLAFLPFPVQAQECFHKCKPALQSLFKLVISVQCPIYLSKYFSQVQGFASLGSFSTEEKVPASSNLFPAHDKNQALSGRMHLLRNTKNNKMK